ncbi:tyrosine-protein phosphatase [Bacteroides propionicifaciens]|jgi:protein-tyrosine phosphatase|uniref:tyrosine-protein phosphatase n=1 Tax=Bacteroides propionicifaciens TaxID=392838 RepID=UPI00036EAE25|nr:CpsB/CapC family capsule biosynthesis tyrosine phosphatase [Bacteroides propionicifaciens]
MKLFSGLFKEKLLSSGLLNEAVDIHCHVLPGVDDGVRALNSALEALEVYKKLGFSQLVCTPHIMSDYPLNEPNYLGVEFAQLEVSAKAIGIKLQLAAEYMLDSDFLNHLEAGPLLTYDGKHVLIENSYLSASPEMANQIYRLKLAGYSPILAHPERYTFIDEKGYEKLSNEGMLFQLNLLSLIGVYGSQAQKKAEYLLSKGYYNFVGTDTHRAKWLRRGVEMFEVKKVVLKQLAPLWDNNRRLVNGQFTSKI